MQAQPPDNHAHDAHRVEDAERLRLLYAISTLLTRFASLERTIPDVFATISRAIPLRSAILVLDERGRPEPRMLVWQREKGKRKGRRMAPVKARARALYAYLQGGSPLEPGLSPHGLAELRGTAASAAGILLPLVGGSARIFGAVHFEGAAPLDELDLLFLDTVGNQLAIAIDRHMVAEGKLATLVAERSAAELETQTARDQFEFARAVTASVGDGVVAMDPACRIIVFNVAAQRLLGWQEADALGQTLGQVVQVRAADGSLVPAEELPWNRAMRRAESLRSEEHAFATREQPPFPVSFIVEPLVRAGRVYGAVLAFRDIIEVKRTEKEQRLLAQVGASMLSSLHYPDMLAGMVRAAVPLLADICMFDELTAGGTIRRRAVAFANEHERRELEDRLKRAAPRRAERTPQAKVLESGESLLWSGLSEPEPAWISEAEDPDLLRAVGAKSLMVVPLHAAGRILGALTLVTTASGRRYAERDLALAEALARRATLAIDNARLFEQAQRATRTRDNLLSIVSHDLKNPLSIVTMALDMMTADLDAATPSKWDDRTRARNRIQRMRRAALRMQRLIEDLLDTASIDAERLSIELTPVAVAPLVSEMLESLSSQAASKPVRLESELSPELPMVLADRARIQQVLSNLLANAMKFTPAGGSIRVRVTVNRGLVTFSVADTGPGIPESDLPHLFDRFWQARSTARLGTGLGLFIAKGIVDAHGGEIWVKSSAGAGSTFSFTLRVAREV